MDDLLKFIISIKLNKNNIKSIFHRISSDYQFEIDLGKSNSLAIDNLIEELDYLCGLLESEDRELNSDEQNKLKNSFLRACVPYKESGLQNKEDMQVMDLAV